MIRDLIMAVVLGFVFAVLMVVVYHFISSFNTQVQDNSDLFDADSLQATQQLDDRYIAVMDKAMAMIIFVLFFGVLILVYLLDVNKWVLFVGILSVILIALFAGYLANAWYLITNEGALSASAAHFTWTGFILSYYAHFTIVWGFLATIIFFMKPQGGGY